MKLYRKITESGAEHRIGRRRQAMKHKAIKLFGSAALILGLFVASTERSPAFPQIVPEGSQIAEREKYQTKQTEPQVAGLRIVYSYETTTAGAAYVRKVFLLFDDGTFTRDFNTLVAGLNSSAYGGNVAVSRRENPRQWGEWRIDPENDFMYKFSYQSQWRDDAATASVPTISDRRFNGCYTAQSTANAARSFGTICFTEDGYFREGQSNAEERQQGIYIVQEPFLFRKYTDETVTVNYIGVYGSGEEISIDGAVFTEQN